MTNQPLELEQLQKELEILRKEKGMAERVNNLRKTKGSISAKFTMYVHDVTARYDDKIYITGSVKDSFYIKPRDARKADDKGNTYSKVHMMFRKISINEREFPADFIRKGDIIEIDSLLTHGFQVLKDSSGNPVLVDGKEINIPTEPQYEGYSMNPVKLTDATRQEYKDYIEARKLTAQQNQERQEKPVETKQSVEQTMVNNNPPVSSNTESNNKPQTSADSSNEPKEEAVSLGNVSFQWND